MQKDFESWLSVMEKQARSNAASNSSAMMMATSGSTSAAMNATDPKVNENLQAFYKARDAIYKDTK
jgi:hypothetical protein